VFLPFSSFYSRFSPLIVRRSPEASTSRFFSSRPGSSAFTTPHLIGGISDLGVLQEGVGSEWCVGGAEPRRGSKASARVLGDFGLSRFGLLFWTASAEGGSFSNRYCAHLTIPWPAPQTRAK